MDNFSRVALGYAADAWASKDSCPFCIVAVGASGDSGLRDVQQLLENFPESLSAIILIVLHRPVDSVSYLREALGCKSTLPVRIAKQGEKLKIGFCYIGEPGKHLVLSAGPFANLIEDSRNTYRNRTVDTLFYSVAEHGGHSVIGVVLSGSLDDGSRGLAAIQKAGGVTMAVTPQVGGVGGDMPEHAIQFNDSIDFVGSVRLIATEIAAHVHANRMS